MKKRIYEVQLAITVSYQNKEKCKILAEEFLKKIHVIL